MFSLHCVLWPESLLTHNLSSIRVSLLWKCWWNPIGCLKCLALLLMRFHDKMLRILVSIFLGFWRNDTWQLMRRIELEKYIFLNDNDTHCAKKTCVHNLCRPLKKEGTLDWIRTHKILEILRFECHYLFWNFTFTLFSLSSPFHSLMSVNSGLKYPTHILLTIPFSLGSCCEFIVWPHVELDEKRGLYHKNVNTSMATGTSKTNSFSMFLF